MNYKELHTRVAVFAPGENPGDAFTALLRAAHEALPRAYAPYSRYQVAAAILMDNGEIITGTNQENMAYPSGLCAERVAIFAAGARYPGMRMHAIAIVASPADGDSHEPSASCGACRQSMLEYELNQQTPMSVWMQGKAGDVWMVESVAALLPLHFDGASLKKG